MGIACEHVGNIRAGPKRDAGCVRVSLPFLIVSGEDNKPKPGFLQVDRFRAHHQSHDPWSLRQFVVLADRRVFRRVKHQSQEPSEPLTNVSNTLLECAYLDVCHAVSLDSSDTATLIELDLPHTAQVCQQVLDEFARLYIPHLECAVRARNNLLAIVLKAGNGPCMSTKSALALPILRVPDA